MRRFPFHNPQDLAGRHIPERYLQGLPPALQRQRVVELTESRDAYQRGDYSELPTDRIARQMGLVKQSAYTTVAKARGIEWRGDSQDMAERVLEYYGAKPTQAQIRSFASALDQVFRKGLAAWKSGGHRPGATAQNWAVARVNSLVVGGKAAWTADKKQFAVLPENARLKVIDQMPDVIEALAAQGRIKDIEFLAGQMHSRTNPSSINQDFGSERVKRRLAARVVEQLGGLCQKCRRNAITASDVICIAPGCNSPGKVSALCAECRMRGVKPGPASNVISVLQEPSVGDYSYSVSKVVLDEKTESDRKKSSRQERAEWGDWTHLERRLYERVFPNSSRDSVRRFIVQVLAVLNSHVPPDVAVGSRDSILVKIGNIGAIHLSPTGNRVLSWGTWFPPNTLWHSRASREPWARVVEVAVLDLARAVPFDRDSHSHPAVSNPLVGWKYVGDPFMPEEIDRVSRPLFSPNAPRVYGEKLKSTILPIFVVIGRPPSESHPGTEAIELANQEAARGNTVLWIKQPVASYLRSLGQSEETIERRLKLVRGEPSRLSPITPFTLLHRMGDVLRAEFKNEADEICRSFDWVTWGADNQTLVKYFSSGVNTLAGRSGYFSNPLEAMSDLWAKYLLTGRIDYDPSAGGPWHEDGLRARSDYLAKMQYFFPRWLNRCRGKIISILGD